MFGAKRRTGAITAGVAVAVSLGTLTGPPVAHADEPMPPWADKGDIPLPSWARTVTPNRAEAAIYAEPGKIELRRGTVQVGARLPLFATRRGSGCPGRWLNVGPLAWMCSDVVDLAADPPLSPDLGTRPWSTLTPDGSGVIDWARPSRPGAGTGLPPLEPVSSSDDGLPFRYFFAGRDGASGFANLATALDDAPDQELEPGFAVSILEEKSAHGERWGKTKKGRWVALRELLAARPSLFHGELVEDGTLDFAWVVADKANVFTSERGDKASGARVRFEKVRIHEEKTIRDGAIVRVSAEGETPAWLRGRDLARPRLVAPPAEVSAADDAERWIDVDLASQTLVAYAGRRPVFATVVSTGKGPAGSDSATHPGSFRIWVKVVTTKMDNLDREEADRHYAIEDVPWVQFFDKAIGFHAAFWHRDFGRVHSHGCVNMAPLDARWLFAFTSPHLPAGWSAVLPTKLDRGAVVHVH